MKQTLQSLPIRMVFACAFVAGFSQASPGGASSSMFDGSVIRPYTNLWTVTITTNHHPKYVGTWSDQVKNVRRAGKSAFLRTQIFKIKNGDTATLMTVFNPTNMRPYSSSFLNSSGDAVLRTFKGSKVVVIDASGSNQAMPTTQSFSVKEDAYDFNAGMYGVLFAGLPLRPGLQGVIATYGQTDASLEHVSYVVRGKSQVTAKPGNVVSAWIVDAHYLDAHRPEGDAQMRFWILTRPPYIIKLIYDLPKEKQTWLYVMK